jgi:long-subunit acyl-CoA synthetase (AMP-forming)
MISHQNILAFLAGLKSHETLNCTKDDTYVSYLPLPHIMERSVAMMLFYEGAYLVYKYAYLVCLVVTL